jgi:YheC/D-like protein
MFPRIANKGIVTNVSSGGYTSTITSFLQEQFGKDYFDMKRYLEVFAVQFSTHFDSLYDEPLDELGIDVGIDQNNKIWIYEVNWRPGTPILFYLEADVAKRMIQYATYLAKEAKKKKTITNDHELTIETNQNDHESTIETNQNDHGLTIETNQVHEKTIKKAIHPETSSSRKKHEAFQRKLELYKLFKERN